MNTKTKYLLTKKVAAAVTRMTRCCSVSLLKGNMKWLLSTHEANQTSTSLTSWKLGEEKFSRDTNRGKPSERSCSTSSETRGVIAMCDSDDVKVPSGLCVVVDDNGKLTTTGQDTD